MPKITVLPHAELCPQGAEIEASSGTSLCDALHQHDIEIDSACGGVCACTTCHIIVRQGFASLNDIDEDEEDMLDRAWGLEPHSRLSCQARLQASDVTVEIPRYSINLAKEAPH